MSIHEIRFGDDNKIIHTRCLDKEIEEAPVTGNYPQIYSKEILAQGLEPNSLPTVKAKTIYAKDVDTVIEEEIIRGPDIETGEPRGILLSHTEYFRQDINTAYLRDGNRRFVWSVNKEYNQHAISRKQMLKSELKNSVIKAITIFGSLRF